MVGLLKTLNRYDVEKGLLVLHLIATKYTKAKVWDSDRERERFCASLMTAYYA